ncbi:MAG: protein arginine kinase [Clostridia bacterium]|nr:protein arginine kinase [Clostridia bacterium]
MAKWFTDSGSQSDVILSTRVRLARNLKGIPFPGKMSADDANKVISLVEATLEEMNYTFTRIDLAKLDTAEKQKLVEERFISPAIAKSTLPCVAYISEDELVSIMVNEEDHIRIQCIYPGYEPDKALDLIGKVDDYLSEKLDYAMHEKYGYLTSCLTNVGTGMRISYMLHLPATVMTGAADSIFATLGKLGITVSGMYGEGTKSVGNIFQISNQTTLGRTEKEIASAVNEAILSVISKEHELQTKLAEKNGIVLEDRILRSYSILKSARIMQSKEMLERLSDVRLGISLGYIDDTNYTVLNNIMITASPAHISAEQKTATAMDRDVSRAEMIRKSF